MGAKQSTLISHVPDALAHGAELRAGCMVTRIAIDGEKRVTGVTYIDERGQEQFQRARAVIVCGYAIETLRLLLNSACPGFETGLANSSGTVGRYLMAQAGNVVAGRFDDLVRMYKAPPAHAMTEEFYETDPARGFARGFAIQTVGPLPIAFAKQMAAAKGAWGWGMRRVMMDYNHWAAIALLGELLPHADNRVELADVKDQFGQRVAKVTFGLKDKAAHRVRQEQGDRGDGASRRGRDHARSAICSSGRCGADGQRSQNLGRGQVRLLARHR